MPDESIRLQRKNITRGQASKKNETFIFFITSPSRVDLEYYIKDKNSVKIAIVYDKRYLKS